jgi:hypothetical protein
MVEVDWSQRLRCQELFMRTAGIQQTLAIRIPRAQLRTWLEIAVFSTIYTTSDDENGGGIQILGWPFRVVGRAWLRT